MLFYKTVEQAVSSVHVTGSGHLQEAYPQSRLSSTYQNLNSSLSHMTPRRSTSIRQLPQLCSLLMSVCLPHWRTSSPNSESFCPPPTQLCFELHFHLGCITSSPVVCVTSVDGMASTPKRVIAFSPLFNPKSHSCFQNLSFFYTNKRCAATAKGKCQSGCIFTCLVLRDFFPVHVPRNTVLLC